MKVFVVVLLVAFAALAQAQTDEQKQKLQQHYQKCVGSSGVAEELIKKMRAGEKVDDPKLKKYVNCMLQATGFIDANAQIKFETIKEKSTGLLNPEELQKLLEACKDIKGSDPDDTAFKFFMCYKTNGGKNIQF